MFGLGNALLGGIPLGVGVGVGFGDGEGVGVWEGVEEGVGEEEDGVGECLEGVGDEAEVRNQEDLHKERGTFDALREEWSFANDGRNNVGSQLAV